MSSGREAQVDGALFNVLGSSGSLQDPEAADRRARLGQCLPRGLSMSSQLSPHQARWLGSCFDDVADRLRQAATRRARNEALAYREGCLEVARAMSTWDPNIGGALVAGRPAAAPGVRLQTVSDPQRVTAGEERLLRALDARGAALAACRDAHGNGRVRAAARLDGTWRVVTWSLEGADGLSRCVQEALRGASTPDMEAWSVAFDVSLRVQP